jgi:hypothetical protein
MRSASVGVGIDILGAEQIFIHIVNKFFLLSIINILGLCVVVAAVSLVFAYDSHWIGFVLIVLGFVCLLSLKPFGIRLTQTVPDIIFGVIDNGILALMAIFGGYFGGIAGAILGGVVGNAITDGIAGIFEGQIAERFETTGVPNNRTMLKSAVGKMSGCLFGAGIILAFASIFQLLAQ